MDKDIKEAITGEISEEITEEITDVEGYDEIILELKTAIDEIRLQIQAIQESIKSQEIEEETTPEDDETEIEPEPEAEPDQAQIEEVSKLLFS